MLKKDNDEHPVPVGYRGRLRDLVAAFAAGDFQLKSIVGQGVAPVDLETANNIARNIAAYGDALIPLHDEVWKTSIYRWMDDYWQVLVDLSTAREPVSDLVLHVKVVDDEAFVIEVQSVHVP